MRYLVHYRIHDQIPGTTRTASIEGTVETEAEARPMAIQHAIGTMLNRGVSISRDEQVSFTVEER